MSARIITDCDACRDALTELICDELDAETRGAVLAHTRSCASCAAELAKLRAVLEVAESLPLEVPSPRVHAAVMLAAREAHARRAALAQAAPRHTDETGFDIFRAWLTRLGSWAMSPQVAMASVLLLMLGVGLVALPLGQDREQTALRAADESQTSAPTATGTALPEAPVSPISEEDALLDRSAAREPAENTGDRKAANESKPAARRRDAARMAEESLAQEKALPVRDDVAKSKLEALVPLKPQAPPDLSGAFGNGKSARPAASPEPTRSKQAFPASREQEAQSGNALDFAPAPPRPASEPAGTVAVPAQAPNDVRTEGVSAETKKGDGASDAQQLEKGVAAARGGEYASAIATLRPLVSQGEPPVRREAALWLARSYRATGDCEAALRLYAPIVEATSASPTVLAEAADCYERTGDVKQASVLRARSKKATKVQAEQPAAASPKQ